VIVSDGLSALAAVRQVPPLLQELLPRLQQEGWWLAPVTIVPQARVALEDEIGHLLGAQLALILLGERPGLGSPDSLGAYLVYGPAPGLTDARRNCVSNIRPEGLPPAVAAQTLHYLLSEARRRKLSGVGLKDERGAISGDAPRALDAASPE
jgi:ethanolamine ammonia-lyase small subunit